MKNKDNEGMRKSQRKRNNDETQLVQKGKKVL